jgi:hypothetical protein
MRGGDERSGVLFSYVDIEARVPDSHPLRVIRDLTNEALAALAGEFSPLYASYRPAFDPAGEVAARYATASLLLDPF